MSNHNRISQYEYEDFEIIKQRSTSFNKLKHRLTVPCSQVRKSVGGGELWRYASAIEPFRSSSATSNTLAQQSALLDFALAHIGAVARIVALARSVALSRIALWR